MVLNDKKRKVTIFLILIIIIFTCFFSIKILTKIKSNVEIQSVLEQNISKSNWPIEVPIIQNKFVNITSVSKKSWEISIKEFISYEEFKAYLIELYSEGFEPIEEMDSNNPKRLSANPPTEEDFVLLWCGKNEKYNIEAYWRNTNYENHDEQEVKNDCVTVLLYENSSANVDFENETQKNENINLDNSFSSENLENNEFSGDDIISSGD